MEGMTMADAPKKKRKLTPAQRAALVANAAKARAALAEKVKRGEHWNSKKNQKRAAKKLTQGMTMMEIPLEAIGGAPPAPRSRAVAARTVNKRTEATQATANHEAMVALGDLILSVWEAAQRRKIGG